MGKRKEEKEEIVATEDLLDGVESEPDPEPEEVPGKKKASTRSVQVSKDFTEVLSRLKRKMLSRGIDSLPISISTIVRGDDFALPQSQVVRIGLQCLEDVLDGVLVYPPPRAEMPTCPEVKVAVATNAVAEDAQASDEDDDADP